MTIQRPKRSWTQQTFTSNRLNVYYFILRNGGKMSPNCVNGVACFGGMASFSKLHFSRMNAEYERAGTIKTSFWFEFCVFNFRFIYKLFSLLIKQASRLRQVFDKWNVIDSFRQRTLFLFVNYFPSRNQYKCMIVKLFLFRNQILCNMKSFVYIQQSIV